MCVHIVHKYFLNLQQNFYETYSMALNQTNKLVWIVGTIYNTGKITFGDLNRKWMDNEDLSGGEELLKRTFVHGRYGQKVITTSILLPNVVAST